MNRPTISAPQLSIVRPDGERSATLATWAAAALLPWPRPRGHLGGSLHRQSRCGAAPAAHAARLRAADGPPWPGTPNDPRDCQWGLEAKPETVLNLQAVAHQDHQGAGYIELDLIIYTGGTGTMMIHLALSVEIYYIYIYIHIYIYRYGTICRLTADSKHLPF